MTSASSTMIVHVTPPPCEIPPGGAGVRVSDGVPLEAGEALEAGRYTGGGDPEGVVVALFPRLELEIFTNVDGQLATAEALPVAFSAHLLLRIERPVAFVHSLLKGAPAMSELDLQQQLAPYLEASLLERFALRSLPEMAGDPDIRAWLAGGLAAVLAGDEDPLGRHGLRLQQAEGYGLVVSSPAGATEAASFVLEASMPPDAEAPRRPLDGEALRWLVEQAARARHRAREQASLARMGAATGATETAERSPTRRMANWSKALRHGPPTELRPEIWRGSLGARVLTEPLSDEDRVFVATEPGAVMAYDANASGAPVPCWPRPAELGSRPAEAMLLHEGLVWVTGHAGRLLALAPDTGEVVHELALGHPVAAAPVAAGRGRLVVAADLRTTSFEKGGRLLLIDTERGQVVEDWRIGDRGIRARPLVLEDRVWLADRGGALFALDLRTGYVESHGWRRAPILGGLIADEEGRRLFGADQSGEVWAIDAGGRPLWTAPRVQEGMTRGGVVSRPLLVEDRLYVGSRDGKVYRLAAEDGRRIEPAYRTHGPIAATPMSWRDIVLIASHDGYLHAYDHRAGERYWRHDSGAPIVVPPAVDASGRLYVVDSEGRLNALHWCRQRYGDAARRMEQAEPPCHAEAVGLWMAAYEHQAAIEAAERAGRLDWVAEIANGIRWYPRAAKAWRQLATMASTTEKRAYYLGEAATAWSLAKSWDEELACRREIAEARGLPLLQIEKVNLPLLMMGRTPEQPVQVAVRNETDHLALDVRLQWEGDVQEARSESLGAIGARDVRRVDVPLAMGKHGQARVAFTVSYLDGRERIQPVVTLDVALVVGAQPEIHKHFHAPHADGDAVFITRGGGEVGPSGRLTRLEMRDGAVVEIRR